MTKLRCASLVIPVLLTACAPEPVDIRITVEGARVIVSTTSALLASVADLAVDTAGRLYALDPRNFHVVVLDADHEHQLTLSREGAGPGEMRFPVAASVDGETLYVADMGNARVDRWTLDGQHVGVVRSDGFGGTGPFSLSGTGWLATGTLGTDSALVELYNAAGQASGKLGQPEVPAPAVMDFRALRAEIDGGHIPAVFRNFVSTTWGAGQRVWLVRQADARIELYDRDGTLRWTRPIAIPEAQVILDHFFQRNRSFTDPTRLFQLLYVADMVEADGNLYLLLNMPVDHPAAVVIVNDAGEVEREITYSDVLGARSIAVDVVRGRVYFGIAADAAIVVAELRQSP